MQQGQAGVRQPSVVTLIFSFNALSPQLHRAQIRRASKCVCVGSHDNRLLQAQSRVSMVGCCHHAVASCTFFNSLFQMSEQGYSYGIGRIMNIIIKFAILCTLMRKSKHHWTQWDVLECPAKKVTCKLNRAAVYHILLISLALLLGKKTKELDMWLLKSNLCSHSIYFIYLFFLLCS